MRIKFAYIIFLLLVFAPRIATAHPGGLAKDGCHKNSRTGERHCHQTAQKSDTPPIPKAERKACKEFKRCTGCGCKGGPGYRDNETKKCVGYKQLTPVCGDPPTQRCAFENAPNSGENEECVTGRKPPQ